MNNACQSVSIWMLSCLSVTGLGISVAQGAEGLAATGPIGGTDIRAALMPPPGLYGVLVGSGWTMGDTPMPNGTLSSSGHGYDLPAFGLFYVYDAQFLGGSLASSIGTGYQKLCFAPEGTGSKPCSQGAMDTYSDLLLWNFFIPDESSAGRQGGMVPIPYGLGLQFGFGVNFPTGAYNSKSSVNVGSNFFDFSPNISFTYTVPSIFGPDLGQATEFSARASFNYYTENPDTDYKTGAVAAIDFAISQRWDNWQFGLAGTAWTQVADDKINGVMASPDGRRAHTISLGPVISYDFIASDRPWNVTVRGVIPVDGEYVPASTVITVRLSTQLF